MLIGAGWVVAVAAAVAWVLPYSPAMGWPVVAQLVAIDKPLTAALVASAVAAGVAGAVRRERAWIIVAAAVAVVAALFAGRVLGVQGVAAGSAPTDGSLVALSWNADGVSPGEVADTVSGLLNEHSADVVVLPETGWKSGELVRDLLVDLGHEVAVFAPQSTATSVILTAELARQYRVADGTPPWAGVELVPTNPSPGLPVIVATHLQQPSPADVQTWHEHLGWVRAACDRTPYVLVLGDMNTTLNHLPGSSLGGCRDVAAAEGAGASSTWPTWLPDWLGVSIDRFMIGPGYTSHDATFMIARDVELAGADHWPIVVSVAPR